MSSRPKPFVTHDDNTGCTWNRRPRTFFCHPTRACGEGNGYVINLRRDEFSVFCFHLALSEKTAVSSPGISLKVSMTRFVR